MGVLYRKASGPHPAALRGQWAEEAPRACPPLSHGKQRQGSKNKNEHTMLCPAEPHQQCPQPPCPTATHGRSQRRCPAVRDTKPMRVSLSLALSELFPSCKRKLGEMGAVRLTHISEVSPSASLVRTSGMDTKTCLPEALRGSWVSNHHQRTPPLSRHPGIWGPRAPGEGQSPKQVIILSLRTLAWRSSVPRGDGKIKGASGSH